MRSRFSTLFKTSSTTLGLLMMLILLASTVWIAAPATRALTTPTNTPVYAYAPVHIRQVEVASTNTPIPTATPTPTYTPMPVPTLTPTPSGPSWLTYLNLFRAQANLANLTENPTWSNGDTLHSRYMVKNDYIGHTEDTGNPWYTAEGLAAAQNGNVMVSSSSTVPDTYAIDLWMSGPFHAIGIIDPQLLQTGYGSYREADGGWQMAATLDVLRGLGGVPGGTTFPLAYPRPNGITWLLNYGGNEAPDPLTSCPGYTVPSGPPIMLQVGSGGITPSVTASSLTQNNTPVEFCIFDETNYVNPNSTYQSIGRDVLDGRDAIVIMPRNPLISGATYAVSITYNSTTYAWSFTAVNAPPGFSAQPEAAPASIR